VFCDKVLLLLLVRCPRVLLIIFACIVCNNDPGAVSIAAAVKYPAPPSQSVGVLTNLRDISCGFAKGYHSCASLLNSGHAVVHIVTCDRLACHLPLKHLLEIVLIVFVLQVETMLAVQQSVRIQLILNITRLAEFVIPRNSVV
jgi:hypothetical protein